MDNTKKFSLNAKIVCAFFVLLLAFWLWIFLLGHVDTYTNYSFGLLIALVPLYSSVVGVIIAKKWGGLRSVVGRAIIFFSLGLLAWSIGTIIFAYYNLFLDVEVPYPSIADIAYVLTTPFWATGIFYLSKAIGASFSLRTLKGKMLLILIPIGVALVSYYLLFVFARGGVIDLEWGIKLFFDILYPLEDVVLLSSTVVIYTLSRNYLGGRYKLPTLLIMTGFALNYFADFSFAYTTTAETYFVANWVDLLFLSAMFVLSIGLLSFDVSLTQKSK